MKTNQHYFSVVQFYPNPLRSEHINIGVLLYEADTKTLHIKLHERAVQKMDQFLELFSSIHHFDANEYLDRFREEMWYFNTSLPKEQRDEQFKTLHRQWKTPISVSERKAIITTSSLHEEIEELYEKHVK